MISYQPALVGQTLPPINALYQYLTAANGVFLRAERPGLKVLLQVAIGTGTIRGLQNLDELVECRAPESVMEIILYEAQKVLPNECLFYLAPNGDQWNITMPDQIRTPGTVNPVNSDDPAGAIALIEVHSHNTMDAYFSATDDKEESFGFRVYAVIGRVNTARPQIVVRIGVHGMFFPIPAHWVFDLGPAWEDAGPYC